MSRSDKLPPDPGLPRPQKTEVWLQELNVRLYALFTRIIDSVNLLTDGYVLPVTTLPTAEEKSRGRIVYVRGAAGVTDSLRVCLKSAADTYSWREIITGG